MHRTRSKYACRCATALLALLLVACGGGQGRDDPADSSIPAGTEGGGTGGGAGDTGMVLPPFDATRLGGGVLATFAVGSEKFRGWFTRAENTQRLVDSFAGRVAPITSVCIRLRLGAGAQGHNAPWTWSVGTILPSNFDGVCLTCASTRPRPSAVQAAVNTPLWLNCTFQAGNSVGLESRAFMQVTLIDVIDRR